MQLILDITRSIRHQTFKIFNFYLTLNALNQVYVEYEFENDTIKITIDVLLKRYHEMKGGIQFFSSSHFKVIIDCLPKINFDEIFPLGKTKY